MGFDVCFHALLRAEGVIANRAFVDFFAVVGYLEQQKKFRYIFTIYIDYIFMLLHRMHKENMTKAIFLNLESEYLNLMKFLFLKKFKIVISSDSKISERQLLTTYLNESQYFKT